jgi:hypothetical protein
VSLLTERRINCALYLCPNLLQTVGKIASTLYGLPFWI